MNRLLLAFVAISAMTCGSASHAQTPSRIDQPYLELREAYGAHDAERAARAYAEDAIYNELYDETSPRLLAGRGAIASSFKDMFQQFSNIGQKSPLDLNFRLVTRHASPNGTSDVGLYRLQVGEGQERSMIYGRFSTQIRDGLFQFDTSTNASADEFESAPGTVLFDADNESLLASYYDTLLGEYAGPDGCSQIITRSTVRLFARNTCTGEWRGLSRVSGRDWTSGNKVIDATVSARYLFVGDANERELQRTVDIKTTTYVLATPYLTEMVEFESADGTRLAGTLYVPKGGNVPRPGVVLVHGSGPQDRHGYASIIGSLADAFAREGMVVLAYDKRGFGASGGDWASASFATLASDASAGMRTLKARPDVDPARIGLAGSSQAGWVVAKAVEAGADPDFTLLIGAAGSALTVEEQNLYNTSTRMHCAGIPADQVGEALTQQRLFYAAKRDPKQAQALKDGTRALAGKGQIQDWLFPGAVDREARNEWFNVLELDFDPLPVWANYDGQAYFLFGEMDDSTPTSVAVERLGDLPNAGKREVVVLPGAQHLAMVATDPCQGELSDVARFHGDFFSTLSRWAESIRGN